MSPSLPAEKTNLGWPSLATTAHTSVEQVLLDCHWSVIGLCSEEAWRRLAEVCPNALRSHQVRPWLVSVWGSQ